MNIIYYSYSLDSIGDMPPEEFESELFTALKHKWPRALIEIIKGSSQIWGIYDEKEVNPEIIREIVEKTFNNLLLIES